MAVVLLVARPIAQASQNLIANQAIAANVSNRIRWQNHWYVVRQSWAFFQNDFAGRIANRVMQTGPAIRETLVALITSVWYILVYGTSALILLSSADPVLALPVVLWFLGYLVMLRVLVPRMRDRSKAVSEGRSMLTGRIVDSYTNILTVKLFARAREEDAYVRDAIDQHTELFYRLAASQHAVQLLPVHAQRHDGDRHGRARARAVDARQGRGRDGGDGAAARLADRERRRLGRAAGHVDLREYRRDPGGHDDHRPADRADRSPRCAVAQR
jgi:ABC-type multidrug transport system fused ATPase/permease subunit